MSNKEIIGYFPSWAIYKHKEFDVKLLPYSKLTKIVYAFFAPNEDGEVVGLDEHADELLLKGKVDWPKSSEVHRTYIPGTSLVSHAHANNCKVIVSIGGWAHSNNFPHIAASNKLRKNFVDSCIHLINEYGFDGIDIDWEFPGYKEHDGGPNDFQNFATLLRELKFALKKKNPSLELSTTLASIEDLLEPLPLDEIQNYVSHFHFFTFDFASIGVTRVVHNAALYTAKDSPLEDSVDSVVQKLINLGIPKDKMIIGLPFYGRAFKRTREWPHPLALYGDLFGDVNRDILGSTDGSLEYYKLEEIAAQGRNWDYDAKVPYIIRGNDFITYEDPESIRLKSEYIRRMNLKGCFIWEITGDLSYNKDIIKQPLLNSVVNELSNT